MPTAIFDCVYDAEVFWPEPKISTKTINGTQTAANSRRNFAPVITSESKLHYFFTAFQSFTHST
jgi:hypothetical protein